MFGHLGSSWSRLGLVDFDSERKVEPGLVHTFPILFGPTCSPLGSGWNRRSQASLHNHVSHSTYITSANIPLLKQTQWAGQHILPLVGETGLVYLLNNNSDYPRGEPKSEHRHFRKNFPVDLLVFLVPSLSTVQGLSLVMVIQAKLFICSTSVHDLDGTPKRIVLMLHR